jgi:hypothetical protein
MKTLKKKKDEWKRSEKQVSDYSSLLRNYIILRLTLITGFKVRQFLSKNGEFIYLVLT